jgi:hypothetical protein
MQLLHRGVPNFCAIAKTKIVMSVLAREFRGFTPKGNLIIGRADCAQNCENLARIMSRAGFPQVGFPGLIE